MNKNSTVKPEEKLSFWDKVRDYFKCCSCCNNSKNKTPEEKEVIRSIHDSFERMNKDRETNVVNKQNLNGSRLNGSKANASASQNGILKAKDKRKFGVPAGVTIDPSAFDNK